MIKPITKHIFLLCLIGSLTPQLARAEFELNFQPNKVTGHIKTWGTHGCDACKVLDQTPFLTAGPLELPELVADPETGAIYYHLIVGSEADGFIQETYIQAGYDTGLFPGGSSSAVGGAGNKRGGNGQDPLNSTPDISTANAEATPKRVLVRQIVSDGEMTMEYLKDRYDRKARISQALNNTEINADFSIDMRNSSFGDANTVGAIANTMNLSGIGIGSFDMSTDTQNSTVTGGLYTYTDGRGYGGADGTYNYIDGHYDHKDQNWERYFDINQINPWSYNANKPTQ